MFGSVEGDESKWLGVKESIGERLLLPLIWLF